MFTGLTASEETRPGIEGERRSADVLIFVCGRRQPRILEKEKEKRVQEEEEEEEEHVAHRLAAPAAVLLLLLALCYYYPTLSIIPKRAGSPLRDRDSSPD